MAIITPEMPDVFEVAKEAIKKEMRVALPGVVTAFDKDKQTCDVQLMIIMVNEDINGNLIQEKFPKLSDVKIQYPRGGGFFGYMPVTVGDNVVVHFCDFSIDQWRASNKESAPQDLKSHDINAPFATLGLYADGQALTSAHSEHMVLGKDTGAKIYIKADEIDLYEENAAQFVALAQKTFDELDKIRTTLNNLVTTVNANNTVFQAHTHGGVTVGPGVTSPPAAGMANATAPATVSSVAAEKVKAT